MNDVNYLVVSSTIDYSSDLICYELERRRKSYLRINRDHFAEYKILYSLETDCLNIKMDGSTYKITSDTLKSVYFRAPVFLRTGKTYSLHEQLYRSQWSAFIRNLIAFDKAKWVNHPVATYRAENKLYQLKCAKRFGLAVPATYLGNSLPADIKKECTYVVKSLDTALFYDSGQEMFTYSTIVTGRELFNAEIKSAPVIIQKCLQNKTDLRVTVIGDELFAVSIIKNGRKIEGDWRQCAKEELNYDRIDLPSKMRQQILDLMRFLGLEFSGIDFALVDGTYYFIEVNPTGEWGWLISTSHLPIDKAIVNSLVMEA
ncbi:MAG: hypothetical protein XD78_1008 [Desulfotomaculum sp. 46_296]|nr:MAG: hypothetical protein XD78_1008 [Desulfotomaculum sp. 46_296]KUK84789.1 MAG: hypothetical protein XE00_0536 [Desulfofundulus kuznetsovii]HAU31931.1 hypothetical protein [Desulfotomaculum sp.]